MRESVAVWFFILVIGDFIEGYKACEREGTEVWYLIREKGGILEIEESPGKERKPEIPL